MDYEWIQYQSIQLVSKFFDNLKISTGGYNIFFFFTNNMNNTDDLDKQRTILDFLIKVSTFEDKAINPNQEEIYKMMKNKFSGFLVAKFYKFLSRDKVFYVIDRDSKEYKLNTIFAVDHNHDHEDVEPKAIANGENEDKTNPEEKEQLINSEKKA